MNNKLAAIGLVFGGIGVFLLIQICMSWRATRRGFLGFSSLSTPADASEGLSLQVLEKLPCYAFEAVEENIHFPADCPVCLENFEVGDSCKLLPSCSHSFHAQCLDTWLLQRPSCPVCRTSVDGQRGRKATQDGGARIDMGQDIYVDQLHQLDKNLPTERLDFMHL
nr:PREDICTED: E3 ubiquitin-protein ligase ATL23-like isoform X2 [Musa acuminata subsp. malaccensis]